MTEMVSLSTCLIAGIHYLIHPHKLGSITATIYPDAILPVTLLTTEEIFGGGLEQILDQYAIEDDVFTPEFGSILIEKAPEDGSISKTLPSGPIERLVYTLNGTDTTADSLTKLPSGPYILHGPNLYQAWRLYEDSQDAFTFGVIPEDVMNIGSSFRPLNSLSPQGFFKSIPVPSRLYSPKPSDEKPLAGVRFSIPDVVSLKGVQTTLSSRAWTSLYPPLVGKTALYAKNLLNLGAIIVGKTKVSHLTSGEQWVDASAPWNPRADLYQNPPGSSAGAGMAAAAYPWLQTVVGEDSIGGLRGPAARGGVYSLRPTFSRAWLDGTQTSSPRSDTLSLASRSLRDLYGAVGSLGGAEYRSPPGRIIYLADLDDSLPRDQLDSTKILLNSLEGFLGAAAEKIYLGKTWEDQPPEGLNGQPLATFLGDAPFRSFCYDYSRQYQDFRDDYRYRFDAEPFTEATTHYRWGLGASTNDTDYKSFLNNIEIFRSWFSEIVLPAGSNTVVVFPYGIAEPKYRQDDADPTATINDLLPEMLSPVLGTPHLVVPVAQTPYESRVSRRTEYLPVSASVMGPAGSDTGLVKLVIDAFEAAGQSLTVQTGRLAFPVEGTSQEPATRVQYNSPEPWLEEL